MLISELREHSDTSKLRSFSAAQRALEFFDMFDGKAPQKRAVPTGFRKLDEALGNGLHDELYIIGGIPSVGKTSFVLQMIDQIAEKEREVLFFTLETSALHVVAKSVSRYAAASMGKPSAAAKNAITVRDMLYSDRYERLSERGKGDLRAAVANYITACGNHVSIIDNALTSPTTIRARVREFIRETKSKPVVAVDYLQILAGEERLSEKQNLDNAVRELKSLSASEGIPVIAISSFNRSSYNTPTTMESFKESGGVEYTADVLLALQYRAVGNKDFNLLTEKGRSPRQVELVVLKDKNGEGSARIDYAFYSKYGMFVEG
jgi:replicative DNA helicase